MAVYKRGYEPYHGKLAPEWRRFLAIARQAFRTELDSHLVRTFLALTLISPVIYGILIYLPHNKYAIELFHIDRLLTIDAQFYERFLSTQTFMGFLLVAFIGPGWVAADLANNALPLYFCRPFTRTEYVLGKLAVPSILLSFLTWVPGLALFGFQATLEGPGWLWKNLYIAGAIFVSSWIWMLLVSLLALALSAWVKWRLAAGALIMASVFVTAGVGEMVYKLLNTEALRLLNPVVDIQVVWRSLFRLESDAGLSFESAFGALCALCALCLYVLWRKIRAYDVERS
jgi:ABC-2 type transport system permease protein